MRDKITILEPRVELEEIVEVSMTGCEDLSGKTVGFVSNEIWQCLSTIWDRLSEVLQSRYGVSKTFKTPVPVASAASPEVLDEVATKSDAVIVGLAN